LPFEPIGLEWSVLVCLVRQECDMYSAKISSLTSRLKKVHQNLKS
jgi:hypothetical protein